MDKVHDDTSPFKPPKGCRSRGGGTVLSDALGRDTTLTARAYGHCTGICNHRISSSKNGFSLITDFAPVGICSNQIRQMIK